MSECKTCKFKTGDCGNHFVSVEGETDLTIPAAIVIGSEGEGMSRLVQKNCDVTVHIPMKGHINSLNASAAASILLYEAVRQRLGQLLRGLVRPQRRGQILRRQRLRQTIVV